MGLAVARLERTANPLDRHRRRSERWQVPGADPVLDILRSIEAVFAADFEAIHREWSTARGRPAVCASSGSARSRTLPRMGDHRQSCRRMPSSLPSRCDHGSLSPMLRPKLSACCSQPMTRVCCSSGTNWRDGLAASAAIPVAARIERSGLGLRRSAIHNRPSKTSATDRNSSPVHRRVGRYATDRLLDLLHSPDDGLQARFLWLWPDKVPPRRPMRCPNAAAALEAFRRLAELRLVLGAGDEPPRPFYCSLTDDAAELFDDWRCEHAAIEVSERSPAPTARHPGICFG